jgi:hypothetical protein
VSAVVTEALARAEVWDRAQTAFRGGPGDAPACERLRRAHAAHRAAQARLSPAEASAFRTERANRRARVAAGVC